jgi:uncharacterized repeat protein (TIGR01451 family)
VRPRSCLRVIQLAGTIVFSLTYCLTVLANAPRILSGHIPAAVKESQPLGSLAPERELRLALGLPLRNTIALNDLLQQLYDPASTNYHRFLTSERFLAEFGPTAEDYEAVIQFARTNGLTITQTHPNRMLVDVSGSVAEIQRVWQLNLKVYQHPTEARTYFAPDSDPVVSARSPLLHISGLDNYTIPHPAGLRPSPPRQTGGGTPLAGAGPGGSYRGNDFRGAYVRGVSLNGSGQMVGLLEFDGYYPADITSYWSQSSVPALPIIMVTMDGYDGTPSSNNVEVALDIEVVSSMAPGLAAIVVYEAGPAGVANDVLNRMATDNLARQLSASWTFPIDATTEQIFLQFAAQGQSYFNSSGDGGAYSGTVSTPTDNPNVTVVGGTMLTTTGPGGAWSSETVWNRGGTGQSVATGGGTSTVYPIPSWQKPVNMTSNRGSTTKRNLPDVAAVAEDTWVTYDNGSSETVGGTSVSSPLWAAFTALVNQQASGFGIGPVGFLNPALYRLGLSSGYTTNFHDITVGNNTNGTSPGQFFAAPGYDLCTGWGSPLGQNLINALAPRATRPVITNVSSTLLSEGCSPGNGAIDPGETVSINIGLKNLGAVKTTDLVATLVADTGIQWPSAPQSYGALVSGGAAVSRIFSFTANGVCGTSLTGTLNLADGTNSLGALTFNFPLGKPVVVLTQNFDSVTAPTLPPDWTTTASNGVSLWITSTTTHDTSPNSAFADEPPSPGVEDLLSPVIPIASTNAQLTFRNSFNTEADPAVGTECFDGGLLEIQVGTNDFADILTAGGSFVVGGYNRTITTSTNSDNPLQGHRVWGGNSGGFINTVVNLPASAAGQSIQLRWRFSVDTGNFYGGFGWYIDGLSVKDGGSCCNPSADLAVFESASVEPLIPGQPLTYLITVTNSGPGSAYGVLVTNALPATVSFTTGSPGCYYTNGMVLCDGGILAGAGATNFTFEVMPSTLDPITNQTIIGAFTPDPNPLNNLTNLVSTIATNLPPTVTLQSTNTIALFGGSASLQAVAFGVAPLSYQWFFNSGVLAGQTQPILNLTNLQPNQSGAYTVSVTNLYGSATSSVVQVTVVAPPTLQLTGVGSADGTLSVSVPSVAGLSYTLEYKNSLTDSNWIPVLPPTSGTGSPLTLIDTNTLGILSRFYRVNAH